MAAREGVRLLVQEVVGSLTAKAKPGPEGDRLVLAALDGRGARSGYLECNQARPRPEAALEWGNRLLATHDRERKPGAKPKRKADRRRRTRARGR